MIFWAMPLKKPQREKQLMREIFIKHPTENLWNFTSKKSQHLMHMYHLIKLYQASKTLPNQENSLYGHLEIHAQQNCAACMTVCTNYMDSHKTHKVVSISLPTYMHHPSIYMLTNCLKIHVNLNCTD